MMRRIVRRDDIEEIDMRGDGAAITLTSALLLTITTTVTHRNSARLTRLLMDSFAFSLSHAKRLIERGYYFIEIWMWYIV